MAAIGLQVPPLLGMSLDVERSEGVDVPPGPDASTADDLPNLWLQGPVDHQCFADSLPFRLVDRNDFIPPVFWPFEPPHVLDLY